MKLCRFLVLIIAFLVPARAGAWGPEAHQLVVERAIPLLPAPLRPFYERNLDFLLAHVSDPDYWTVVGFEQETHRHFLNLDAYGRMPFEELPRDYAAAIRKFGTATIERNGVLPWRTEDIYRRLVRAFRDQGPYGLDDVRYLSAILAHYVADAQVPLHANVNYDGQLTGQTGLHARFEIGSIRRAEPLTFTPAPARLIADPRGAIFSSLMVSFGQVHAVLEADRRAFGAAKAYDDRYYAVFTPAVRPILERCLSDATTLAASMLMSAWEEAGRPELSPRDLPQKEKPSRRHPAQPR